MKNISLIAGLCLLSVAAAVSAAGDGLSNVQCSQRWPWSPKVDITCDYTGNETTSVVFTATWVGQEMPVTLLSMDPDDSCELKPGANRFTWDPVLAGYGNKALVNFKVEAAVTNADPRTYLVVDLKDGGYSFLATPPAGGWTDEYKLTKLVFRRVPKGAYQLGTSEYGEFRAKWSGGQSGAIGRHWTKHEVVYSADYYFQIFFLAGEQLGWLRNGFSKSGDTTPTLSSGMSYAAYRGATLDDGVTVVDWPTTGHKVNSTSLVGKLRALTAKKGQPELLADLPTDQQWQLAMSGGSNTFFPNGGVATDDQETLDAYYAELAWPGSSVAADRQAFHHPVGSKGCNCFGIYDFNVWPNPLLDWIEAEGYVDTTNPSYKDRGDRIDFPGRTVPYATMPYRLLAGAYNDGTSLNTYRQTIYMRFKHDPTETDTCIAPRFVINLKPIVDVQ